jgi:hypothetical protein
VAPKDDQIGIALDVMLQSRTASPGGPVRP